MRTEPVTTNAGEQALSQKSPTSSLISAIVVIALSIVYFYATINRAQRRFVWYDETFTERVAHLPSMQNVWHALTAGIDNNPPLLYWLTRISESILGETPLGLRLPEVTGYWLFSLSLFFFVRRRFGIVSGIVAMLTSWMTWAYVGAAYEARAYGLLMGAFGIALLCWQLAAENYRRYFTVPCLGLALLAALLSHCYAVLIYLPFAAAEVYRTVRYWRFDWPVLTAMIVPSAAILTYIPLLGGAKKLLVRSWSPPQWNMIDEFHKLTLESLLTPITLVAVVVLVVVIKTALSNDRQLRIRLGFKGYELVFLAFCLLLPMAGVIVGKVATGVMTPRYALPAVTGYIVLLAAIASLYKYLGRVAGIALVLLLACWFLVQHHRWAPPTNPATAFAQGVAEQAADLPIVAENGGLYVELMRQLPAHLRPRVYCLLNAAAARQYVGFDVLDLGLPMQDQYFSLGYQLVDYDNFVRQHPHFVLYGAMDRKWSWLPQKVVADGATVELGSSSGLFGWYKVDFDDRENERAKL